MQFFTAPVRRLKRDAGSPQQRQLRIPSSAVFNRRAATRPRMRSRGFPLRRHAGVQTDVGATRLLGRPHTSRNVIPRSDGRM